MFTPIACFRACASIRAGSPPAGVAPSPSSWAAQEPARMRESIEDAHAIERARGQRPHASLHERCRGSLEFTPLIFTLVFFKNHT